MTSRENLISLIDEMFDKCINAISENVKNADDQKEYFKDLEKSVYECANLDVKHKCLEKVIDESNEECLDKGQININEVFKRNSTSIKYENYDSELKNHRFLKNFQNKTARVLQASEESSASSLAPTNTRSLPLDPITQVPIVSPVRNKLCGHLYEKSSIKKMFAKKRQKILCPYVGCASQNYFVYADLEENVSLTQENVGSLEINDQYDDTL